MSAVVLFVLVFAYNYFIRGEKQKMGVEEITYQNTIDQQAEEILRVLDEVLKIEIRTEFFNGKNISYAEGNLVPFNDLIDYASGQIPDKEVGKVNPFIIGGGIRGLSGNEFTQENTQSDNTEEETNTDQAIGSQESGSENQGKLSEKENEIINN